MADVALSLADLERLLDVRGTARERWPSVEWDAAARLVAGAPEARALWDAAVALDGMLGALTPVAASPALVARVLDAAPRRRVSGRWRRVAAAMLPLAAAAGVALWLACRPGSAPQVADRMAPELGEYTSPTDTLLDSYAVDVSRGIPSLGCDDSTLACPSLDGAAEPAARSRV
jgi:hypothetical protein